MPPLITTSLDGNLKYDALSYVWGGAAGAHSPFITVNGSAVLITTNLRDTLCALRNKGVLTLLWIDALCINQKDKKERVTQVKMMANLYKNAANVSTWLGDANEIEVWDNLTQFLQDFTALVDEDSLLYQPFYRTHGAMDSISFDDGINEMMGGDWFTRIWVVQEAALHSKQPYISALGLATGKLETRLYGSCGASSSSPSAHYGRSSNIPRAPDLRISVTAHRSGTHH
jgi:hypothetical protein